MGVKLCFVAKVKGNRRNDSLLVSLDANSRNSKKFIKGNGLYCQRFISFAVVNGQLRSGKLK